MSRARGGPSEHPAAPACPEESNLRETARYGCIRAAVGSLIQREPDRSADFLRSSPDFDPAAHVVAAVTWHRCGRSHRMPRPRSRARQGQALNQGGVFRPVKRGFQNRKSDTRIALRAALSSLTPHRRRWFPSGDLSIARRIVTGRPRHRCAVWLGKGASAQRAWSQDRARRQALPLESGLD